MGCFQVFEDHEGIEADIRRRLAGLGGGPEARSSGQRPALLVVSPRAALRSPITAACRTALLPGDPPLAQLALQAASAVSYGSGPRNTLTLSSRTGDRLWMALQRELVTVQGQVVERQEFTWRLSPGSSPQAALAVAGALLLLGISPEQLSSPPQKSSR